MTVYVPLIYAHLCKFSKTRIALPLVGSDYYARIKDEWKKEVSGHLENPQNV
jgi:hypothetical protein